MKRQDPIPPDPASLAFDAIARDISERAGLKHVWNSILPVIKQQIRRDWERIIRDSAQAEPARTSPPVDERVNSGKPLTTAAFRNAISQAPASSLAQYSGAEWLAAYAQVRSRVSRNKSKLRTLRHIEERLRDNRANGNLTSPEVARDIACLDCVQDLMEQNPTPSPLGLWKEEIRRMSDSDREKTFACLTDGFCIHCGRDESKLPRGCQCQNDD